MSTKFSKASLRGLRARERTEMMRASAKATGVRVVPANEDVRRVMKHPHSGGFPKTGGAEWPDDRFTKRRLADGSVTREATSRPSSTDEPDKGDQRRQHRTHQDRDEPNNAA